MGTIDLLFGTHVRVKEGGSNLELVTGMMMAMLLDTLTENLRVAEFEIFDFGSDCGRVIDDAITWGIFSAGVSFNGNTYWMLTEKNISFPKD